MTLEEAHIWLEDMKNRKIFKPYNAKPTQDQLVQVFAIANFLDPKGNHKLTGCGRCVYNALRVIEKKLEIF